MKHVLVFLPRGLALLWAGFWMFFFVAESWAWQTPVLAALPWVGVGLFFVLLALLPWRWERTGGLESRHGRRHLLALCADLLHAELP